MSLLRTPKHMPSTQASAAGAGSSVHLERGRSRRAVLCRPSGLLVVADGLPSTPWQPGRGRRPARPLSSTSPAASHSGRTGALVWQGTKVLGNAPAC